MVLKVSTPQGQHNNMINQQCVIVNVWLTTLPSTTKA